jgi:hypothetical protein
VIVRGHEAVDVAGPKKGARCSRELDEEVDMIGLVTEECASGNTASRDVEHAVIEKTSWSARHSF